MTLLKRLAFISLLLSPSLTMAAGMFGEVAPDFPPGVFSDGQHYDLTDFRGKVLVIFFFESECPTCKGMVPQWNKLMEQYKDKPVKFLAVGPHNSLAGVRAYVSETRLEMPVFADNLNIMEAMYGETISLQNVRQFRIVGPDGKVMGYEMSAAELDKAIAKVSWKYKDKGYDPRLNNIINLLEWNQDAAAVKQLRPLVKAQSPSLAESAGKLYAAVKSEAEQWKADADGMVSTKPVEAFDLYTKVSTVLAGDDLAKSVADPLKTLKAEKTVSDELAARAQYAQLYSSLPRAQAQQRKQAEQYCKGIVSRYPDTPTAKKADALAAAIAMANLTGN
jgi:thiol-disulfide isomerase/thioredoxin